MLDVIKELLGIADKIAGAATKEVQNQRMQELGGARVELSGYKNLSKYLSVAVAAEQQALRKLREQGPYDDGYRRD